MPLQKKEQLTHTSRLIIEMPINQYASYAVMFCLIHSSISKLCLMMKPLHVYRKSSPMSGCEERMEYKGYKGSTMMQAL